MSMYRKGRSPSFYHGGHILEQSGTPTSQHARSMTKATVAINALHALTGEKGAIEKWVPPPAGSVSRRDLHPARNVHNCGVTVGWLLKFFYYCNDMFSSTSFSAMDVVEEIIAPSNLQHGCAFCCLPTVDLCSPSAVVSYAPDRPLRELVYCLKQRFRGSHDAAVWIDMFSLQNPCNSRDYLEALPKLVATVPDVMVVADPGGGWCSQPLCLLTAFHASREPEGPGRLQLLTNCVTAEHARDVGIEIGSMSVSQSLQSSDTVDIEGINEHIASHTPGRGAMETEIREIISTAMARLDHFPPQDLVSPKSLDVASSAVIRAAILRSSGSYDRAQALLEEALAIRIDRLGHDHALVRRRCSWGAISCGALRPNLQEPAWAQ